MEDLVARSEQFVDAYNRQDFDALGAMIVPDLDFAHFNRAFAFSKRDELIAVLRHFAAEFVPDRHFEPAERVTQVGRTVIREAWYTGTPKVDLPGFGEAGQPFRLKFCSLLTFGDDGRVAEWKDYG